MKLQQHQFDMVHVGVKGKGHSEKREIDGGSERKNGKKMKV